jgi:hypothetical protein
MDRAEMRLSVLAREPQTMKSASISSAIFSLLAIVPSLRFDGNGDWAGGNSRPSALNQC